MRLHEALHKPVTVETVIVTLFVVGMVVANVLFGVNMLEYKAAAQKLSNKVSVQKNIIDNERELSDFFAFFITKVLVSNGDITFDDRLELENRVRRLGDEEVLERWERFTHAGTEAEAQEEVRGLLGVLAAMMRAEAE